MCAQLAHCTARSVPLVCEPLVPALPPSFFNPPLLPVSLPIFRLSLPDTQGYRQLLAQGAIVGILRRVPKSAPSLCSTPACAAAPENNHMQVQTECMMTTITVEMTLESILRRAPTASGSSWTLLVSHATRTAATAKVLVFPLCLCEYARARAQCW